MNITLHDVIDTVQDGSSVVEWFFDHNAQKIPFQDHVAKLDTLLKEHHRKNSVESRKNIIKYVMLTSKGKLDARLAAGIKKEVLTTNKQSFSPKKYSGNDMLTFLVAKDELVSRKSAKLTVTHIYPGKPTPQQTILLESVLEDSAYSSQLDDLFDQPVYGDAQSQLRFHAMLRITLKNVREKSISFGKSIKDLKRDRPRLSPDQLRQRYSEPEKSAHVSYD